MSKWNYSEPPKDRWIIRWNDWIDFPMIVKWVDIRKKYVQVSTSSFWEEDDFAENCWMEAPQKPER